MTASIRRNRVGALVGASGRMASSLSGGDRLPGPAEVRAQGPVPLVGGETPVQQGHSDAVLADAYRADAHLPQRRVGAAARTGTLAFDEDHVRASRPILAPRAH